MWLTRSHQILRRILRPVSFGSMIISGVAVLLMICFIVLDVVIRGVFNVSFPGTIELVRVLMILAVFGGMSYAALENAHIRVDILVNLFSRPVKRAVIAAADLLAFCVVLLISIQTFIEARTLWAENANTGLLQIPFAPFALAASVFLLFFAFALLCDFLAAVADTVAEKTKGRFILFGAVVICIILFFASLEPSILPISFSPGIAGVLCLIFMFLLIFLGVHIGAAMAFITLFGFSYLVNPEAGRTLLSMTSISIASDYIWSVFPMFAFLGLIAASIGLGKDIYETAYKWLGHSPGGLASATVAGCSGLAAVVGDSTTGVVTMSAVAYPEMKARGYDEGLMTGCICAGGAIGILIPPSIGLLVYSIITEQSIGKLFLAGLLPGLLETLALVLYISIICKRKPHLGPPGDKTSFKDKILSLKHAWQVVLLFLLVIGGIYTGVFSAYEAAAVGAFTVMIIGIITQRLTFRNFFNGVIEATKMTSFLLFIFVYANALSQFLAISQIPVTLANFVIGLGIHKYGTLFAIIVLYILIGCVMNVLPAMILTLPILYPTVTNLGFDPIWFGVVVTITLEIGVLTPPIGMNVFAMSGIVKEVPIYRIFKGVTPFWLVMILVLLILTVFPQISLILVQLMH